jgi:hypothetical protein
MVQGEPPLMDAGNGLAIRHIEVALAPSFPPSQHSDLKSRLELWIKSRKDKLPLGKNGEIDLSFLANEMPFPQANRIVKLRIVDDNDDVGWSSAARFLPRCPSLVHMFQLSNEEISVEEIEPSGGGDEWTAGCDSLALPHVSLDGLWENLIFDSHIKLRLLEYAQSAILFSDRKVSEHIVHWNRILLLHG